MTDEEAIERMQDLIHTCEVGIEKHGEYDDLFQKDKEALERVLKLIEKKDKIIHLMASHIKQPKVVFQGGRGHGQIIKYFEKKVEG